MQLAREAVPSYGAGAVRASWRRPRWLGSVPVARSRSMHSLARDTPGPPVVVPILLPGRALSVGHPQHAALHSPGQLRKSSGHQTLLLLRHPAGLHVPLTVKPLGRLPHHGHELGSRAHSQEPVDGRAPRKVRWRGLGCDRATCVRLGPVVVVAVRKRLRVRLQPRQEREVPRQAGLGRLVVKEVGFFTGRHENGRVLRKQGGQGRCTALLRADDDQRRQAVGSSAQQPTARTDGPAHGAAALMAYSGLNARRRDRPHASDGVGVRCGRLCTLLAQSHGCAGRRRRWCEPRSLPRRPLAQGMCAFGRL